jgi:hypothetical protein
MKKLKEIVEAIIDAMKDALTPPAPLRPVPVPAGGRKR